MSFSWWRPWVGGTRAKQAGRRLPSLKLEILEDRLTPAVHTWTGATSALWDNPGNWLGGVPTSDEQNVQLIFGADAALNRATTNNIANLTISSITFRTAGYTLSGTAVTLASNATLQTEGATAFDVAINLNVALAGVATVNVGVAASNIRLGGVVSGSGGLTKLGPGRLELAGTAANTYTGTTLVNAGTLLLNKTAGINAVVGSLTLGDGTGGADADVVRLGAANQIGDTVAITGTASGRLDLAGFAETIGTLAGVGNVTLGTATLTLGLTAGEASFAGVLSGSGGLTKVGASVQTLAGTNTYTGATTINAGTLRAGAATVLAAGTAVTVASGATLDLNSFPLGLNSLAGAGTVSLGTATLSLGLNNTASTFAGILSGAGSLTKVGTAMVTLSGANTYTGVTTVMGGTLRMGRANALASATTVNLGNSAMLDLNNFALALASLVGNGQVTLGSATLTVGQSTGTAGYGGIISGTGGLTKVGTSTQVLTAAAQYTGATAVNAGTLRLGIANALAAASAVTVAAAATLDLNNFALGLNALSGAGSVTLGSATLTLGLSNATSAFAGILSGTGGLTKVGTGTLTLSGANTYSGATAINGGTVTLGAANALGSATAVSVAAMAVLNLNGNSTAIGSLAGAGNVTLGAATLTAGGNNTATTYTGVINGTGGLTKVGTAFLTLGGANTYTGATTVNAGTLTLNVVNALTGSTAATVAAGATLNLNGNALTVASLAGAGNVTLGTATLTTGSGNTATTFSGILSGTGGLTKVGTGILTLGGANTYTGATAINAGTLAAGAVNVLPGASAITVGATATLSLNNFNNQIGSLAGAGLVNLGTGTLTVGTTTSTTFSGNLLGGGGLTKIGTGTLTLSGNNSYSGATAVNAGTLQSGSALALPSGTAVTVLAGATLNLANQAGTVGSLAGAGNVTLGSATLTTGGNNLATSFTGVLSGTGGLTKVGTGVLTLGGNNTYTGATLVNGGTLLVNGTQTVSVVTVAAAGTLGGSGSVGDVTTAGIVTPGASPGILRARSINFLNGSSYRPEVNGTTAGTGHDQLNLTGNVNLTSGPELTVTLGYTAQANDRIVLITTTGQLTGTFRNLANNTILAVNGLNFRVNYNDNGNNVVLTRVLLDTTTALATSGSPTVFGQQVRFTATVTASTGTPTGVVTFRDGTTTLGTANLTNGQAEFTTTTLAAITHTISAVYAGDVNYRSSTSGNVTQVVNKAATTIAVVSSLNPSNVGQEVTFTATISVTAPGSGTVTGQVTFFDGNTNLGTGTVANGQATFRTSSLTAGPHAITAEYAGDNNFLASSRSAALTQTINRIATTVALTADVAAPVFGQSVTFTAVVSATSGGAPTGRVSFRDGETLLGAIDLQNGRATFSTSTLTVGSHTIRASYDGNTQFNESSATPLAVAIAQAATTAVLSLSDTTLVFGQTVTLTATITVTTPGAGNPSGSVTFRDGTSVLGTGTLTGNRATLTTSALGVGARTLTVEYAGDTNFVRSTSPVINQTVNKARTSISLTSSSTSVAVDANVTFTATVAITAPGGGTLQGSVVFKDGTTTLGTATLGANRVATLTVLGLFGGTRSITAEFAGDTNFEQSTSAAVSQTVTGTTNQFYVAGLYRSFFKRAPDREGLTFWVGRLQNGATRLEVTRGFTRSAEYAGVQVDQVYRTILRRAPETAGREFWIRQFQAGASESDVQRGFLTAQEYRDRNATDANFVSGLYQDLFGRQPDTGGQATFTQRLQSGETRDSIALAFLNTPERIGRVIDQFYLDLLGRPADAGGRQTYLALFAQGSAPPLAIGESLAVSPEFATRAGSGS